MRLSQSHRTGSSRKETIVLFSAAGFVFAIPARAVDEVREVAGLREFSGRSAKVQHTLDRQGQRYFVVDAARHFRLHSQNPGRLLLLRHAPVAVLVDGIDRMQEIQSIYELPPAFIGEERAWYRGLTLVKSKVIPVVHPEAFLSKAEVTLLNASAHNYSLRSAAVTA